MDKPKIAIVHDYIKEYGGAERVLETLHEMYPHAPVYTLVYCPNFLGPHKERFKDWHIIPSILQFVPWKEKLISPFRLFAPIIFRLFDFSGYDIILVSATGAYSPNIINKKSAKQICYSHTPPRYLYGYATARNWQKTIVGKVLGEIVNHILRMVDFTSSQRVDRYIANSENVRKRIQKFYRKDATVIYPPVDIEKGSTIKKGNYYLAGGRLARPKHIDLIIQAANDLYIPLKIFGKDFAGYEKELQEIAGSTVEFLGEVTDEQKKKLLAGAKAYLFASEDEDFGILPVESMSQGTPVIAYKSGGVVEAVLDGKTGLFFNELTKESLSAAIQRFGKLKLKASDCEKQAKKFSKKEFEKKIQEVIKQYYA